MADELTTNREPATDAPPAAPPPTRRAAVARWVLALAIGVGGAWAVQRLVVGARARAVTRVVLLDWRRFEGCMLGPARLPESALPDAAVAMAQGTGDPAWPHSCAPPLTRIERVTDEARLDDASSTQLARAVSVMQVALGDAVIWTRHVQQGHREAPQWVGAYVALRREVAAFAARRGVSLAAPELPRHPRVPRRGDEPVPPPPAVPLDGGDEADILDATASGEEFAVVLRDRRTRYTVCRAPAALPEGAPVLCERFEVPRIADPRYAGFAPSERGAYLAIWGRAPYSLRGLVQLTGRRIALIAAGDPDARRDFWVGPSHELAMQVDHGAPSILVAGAGGTSSTRALPASADVLTDDRALVGTPRGAAEVWLDTRAHASATLRSVPLALDGALASGPRVLATWRAPRLSGQDRRVVPCTVPGVASYVVAGDATDAEVFATSDGASFTRWAPTGRGITRETDVVCDAAGVALVTRRDGADALEAIACDPRGCVALPPIAVRGAASVARVDGALLVADAGGEGDTARVRAVSPAAGGGSRADTSALAPPVPPARAVRLVARGHAVALFVAAQRTYALLSRDAGRSFVPAVVALPAAPVAPSTDAGAAPAASPR